MRKRGHVNYPAERKRRSVMDRFMAKVLVVPDACWIWVGTRTARGYGLFRIDPSNRATKMARRQRLASRVSYELFVGPCPDGLELDHLCREHSCVNWRHLEPVSHRVNVLRGVGPTAVNARKTHCFRCGEPLVSTAKNGRRCPRCARAAGARHCRNYRARKAAAATGARV